MAHHNERHSEMFVNDYSPAAVALRDAVAVSLGLPLRDDRRSVAARISTSELDYADHSDPDSMPSFEDIAEMHAQVETAANERGEDWRAQQFDYDMRNAGMWLDRAYQQRIGDYAAMALRVAENARDYAQTDAERSEVDTLVSEANAFYR